ncbi:hypothetical protein O9992_01615 [Vibrio lentus]|nr:hypothetical protein [Vibrio lentus]
MDKNLLIRSTNSNVLGIQKEVQIISGYHSPATSQTALKVRVA